MSASPVSNVSLTKFTYLLLSIIALVTILVVSEEYIVPFIIALIIWFIIHELRENIQMVPFMRKHFPMWLQSMIGFFIICVVLVIVGELLYISMSTLTERIDDYQVNFEIIMFQLSSLFGVDVMSMLDNYSSKMDIAGILSSTLDITTSVLGNTFLILLYVLFLLIEESIFPMKLEALYKSESKYNKTQKLFQKMDKNISRYLSLKTVVSLLTGILSYIVFLIFDLDAAIFWAMLIFVLNYIPTIGSLIATLFPALFAIFQFGEFGPALYILIIVGIIQVVVGNIVEPKIMGNSLNISSLVVILSLTIWGAIWGIMGMILSVPITVMMIIVFEEIPGLRPIAIMLSERGNISMEE
ncbi:MAG: AI-2E family transporter [Cyclobacteriaceae bacterium]|nr:AI-2E family transporter [Cyclobacteriaceae bacterium]